MRHLWHPKVCKWQSVAGIYQVPDSVRFVQVQITDVPEPVPVYLWHDHTVANEQLATSHYMK